MCERVIDSPQESHLLQIGLLMREVLDGDISQFGEHFHDFGAGDGCFV